MELLESKSLLAKLMATENLVVEQRPVPTASFDVKNRILTLPVLDKNISGALYDLFTGHEVGHALYTPIEGMIKAKEEKIIPDVTNVVEDSRIERKIKYKYPGLKNSFVKAYSELVEKDFFGTKDKIINEMNFIDRVNLHCKGGANMAIRFSEEERELLNDVESTETWEEVVITTKRIIEYMKAKSAEEKQLRQLQKSEESDEDLEQITLDEDSDFLDEEYDLSEDSDDTDDTDEDDNDEDSKESGSGTGDDIRSYTDEAFRSNEYKLFSAENIHYTYANIPKFDIKKGIWDYKNLYQRYVEEGHEVAQSQFIQFKRESSKVVSYLVKEFELRKNADQLKRASIAKTGDLNLNKIFSYRFSEDIFKKITVVPGGKSHGLIMYLDWSGSMAGHLGNTMKQLFNLAMFCKKVNIPFEVYAFIQDTDPEKMYSPTPKTGNLHLDSMCLLNIISSRMSAAELLTAGGALFQMSGLGTYRWVGNAAPQWMRLGGTPLNEAVISALEVVPAFQKRNKLQVVNTVFLTDGDGSLLEQVYDESGYRNSASQRNYRDSSFCRKIIFRDPVTKNEESCERMGFKFGSYRLGQTSALIRLLKRRTNSHVIGFYIGSGREIRNRMEDFYPELQYNEREKKKEEFRKSKFLVVNSTGFDDYYVLRSTGLDIDEDAEFEVRENATTRGLVSAFSKYAGNRINNRVILNRFIGLIS